MSVRKEVAVPFDTLAYAKKLEVAGIEAKQAEAHAEVLANVLEGSFVDKTTWDYRLGAIAQEMGVVHNKIDHESQTLHDKINHESQTLRDEIKRESQILHDKINHESQTLRDEIKRESQTLRGEIQTLRSEMNTKFADFKVDIIKWMFNISLGQAAVIISALKFIHV